MTETEKKVLAHFEPPPFAAVSVNTEGKAPAHWGELLPDFWFFFSGDFLASCPQTNLICSMDLVPSDANLVSARSLAGAQRRTTDDF